MSFDDARLAEARLDLIAALVRTGEDPKEKAHSAWARSIESTDRSNRTVNSLATQEANIKASIRDLEAQIAPAKGNKLKELLAQKQKETGNLKNISQQLAEHRKVNEGHAKHMFLWSTLATASK
jgi:hypothetical protein